MNKLYHIICIFFIGNREAASALRSGTGTEIRFIPSCCVLLEKRFGSRRALKKEVMSMKAGFIGAGKVGFSLGKYLKERGTELTGYYSRSNRSAIEAAEFTDTKSYENLADIVNDSDTLFITVPDGAIGTVWEELRNLPIKDKNICHCSGSISSTVFFDAEEKGASAYSIHPIYAINDKEKSYKELEKAYFSMEGSENHLKQMKELFQSFGNKVIVISKDKKSLYHCAAVTVSNHIAALADLGISMLIECGFQREEAKEALAPLLEGNARSVAMLGPEKALTGPVERGDTLTIEGHLQALKAVGEKQELIYRLLSDRLIEIAHKKHPDRDYEPLEKIIRIV